MKSDPKKIVRKPYRQPKLAVYGDIREITQNVGMSGAPDGGKGNNKTG